MLFSQASRVQLSTVLFLFLWAILLLVWVWVTYKISRLVPFSHSWWVPPHACSSKNMTSVWKGFYSGSIIDSAASLCWIDLVLFSSVFASFIGPELILLFFSSVFIFCILNQDSLLTPNCRTDKLELNCRLSRKMHICPIYFKVYVWGCMHVYALSREVNGFDLCYR